MRFNFDLFIDILWLGTLSGVISTICLQKIKNINLLINHRLLYVIIHIFIGYSISRLFTNLSVVLSIATGVITWIGAETIYDKLNSKNMLTSRNYSEIKKEVLLNEEIEENDNYESLDDIEENIEH